MASNKQDKILLDDDEFVNTYVEKIVQKVPQWDNESDKKYVFQLFKGGSTTNIRKNPTKFTITYGMCSTIWNELRAKVGLEVKPGTSYREYFCNSILDIDYTIVQDEYLRLTEKAPEEPYPHETVEKPTASQVTALVETVTPAPPTDTDLKQALWDILPMLSKEDWDIINLYKETVLS